MGQMTNESWLVFGQDIYQPKLALLTNLFPSVWVCSEFSCFARPAMRIFLRRETSFKIRVRYTVRLHCNTNTLLHQMHSENSYYCSCFLSEPSHF